MAKKQSTPPPVEAREFRSTNEIDFAITKIQRRLQEVEQLNIALALAHETGAIAVVESNIRSTVLDVFGQNSPEYAEHQHIQIWSGSLFMGMDDREFMQARERGRNMVKGILQGLIDRLKEKRLDLDSGVAPVPSSYFDHLNLHPRILDVARDLFLDGYHWEAVFAAAKALVNYVKERSGCHDLDGAPLMRKVFSKNDPVLAFNALANPTEFDEQEGMMHLFEGAVMGIRNPGGHLFPEGPEQRAIEYVSLLSLLAYRVQEAKRRPTAKTAT